MYKTENLGEKLFGTVMALAIAVGAAWGTWRDLQPKFRDVAITVAEEMPSLIDFTTEFAVSEKCAAVTDLSALENSDVGVHEIVLRQGAREETVTLTIVDNVAPQLKAKDLDLPLDVQVKEEDAVEFLWDHTPVKLSFDRSVEVPEDYSPLELKLIAEDTSGNTSTDTFTVRFNWMRDAVNLEFGQSLTREDLLYAPEKDAAAITDEMLAQINAAPVGEHEITSTIGERTLSCLVNVQDTQGPVLELREYQTYPNKQVKVEKFVVSATDVSGKVTLTMLTEPDTSEVGSQIIQIEAKDIYGNVTIGETTLYIATDFKPPVISGAGSTLSVEKNSTPNYLAGVKAVDDNDGAVKVSVDASRVNTAAAGSYVAVYTARDKAGNVATVRRKVVVAHDAADTAALVKSIADKQGNDPEAIRNYVRSSIRYSSSWGGDDPVWTGFTDKHGNCYVHALCLKSILDLKGFNTQLIWVTNKTHYWLIIEIQPGVWRHIDPTPSNLHGRYSLMTDTQRHSTLSGRDWDRTAWPACE